MKVELNKKSLVCLVVGSPVSYELIQPLQSKNLGTFSGSYDRWDWNRSALEKLTDEKLLELHNLCFIGKGTFIVEID